MTTIPPATDSTVTSYPYAFGPTPNITPFTYRDGLTYLERYEDLVRYLNRVVIPFINDQVAIIIENGAELQDPVMAEIINDVDSLTRAALDEIYLTQGEFNDITKGTVHVIGSLTDEEKADIASGTPLIDLTSKVQAAINAVGNLKGGTVIVAPGTWLINGTLIVPSNVRLEGYGATLKGSNTNTLFESGYMSAGVAVSNIPDFDTDQGVGTSTHHTVNAKINGFKIVNVGVGFRLSWFVRGSSVNDCEISAATYSIRATCSWGQSYTNNTFRTTVYLSHYVDWTTLQGNSFEACNNIGLLIGPGGSWSLRIVNNGFHWITSGEGTAIKFEYGVRNTVIESNHFESNKRHIYGSAYTSRGMTIRNNHLAATGYNNDFVPVIAVEFLALRSSILGPNDFENATSNPAALQKKYILDTDSCYFNKVVLDPDTSGDPIDDLSKSTIRATNIIEVLSGSINAANTQPEYKPLAGTSGKTFEQYDRKYNFIANLIPNCTVDRTGGTVHVINTFIDAGTTGVAQPAQFFLTPGGPTNSYRIAGTITGRYATPTFTSRENIVTGAAGPTVVFDNNAGKLRITISGLDNPSTITGFIKAL